MSMAEINCSWFVCSTSWSVVVRAVGAGRGNEDEQSIDT